MNENKSTSSKDKFVRSFFGRNMGLKKSFRICLTFNGSSIASLNCHRDTLHAIKCNKNVTSEKYFHFAFTFGVGFLLCLAPSPQERTLDAAEKDTICMRAAH